MEEEEESELGEEATLSMDELGTDAPDTPQVLSARLLHFMLSLPPLIVH